MLISLFLKGSLIGLSIAMPVGPVGMICIQNSLRRGLSAGLIAGIGSALADALYGGLAGFGVSVLSHMLNSYQLWFQLVGAVILWILGIKIFKSQPTTVKTQQSSFSSLRIFLSTFLLTLTNPFTLICFAAIYASLGISAESQDLFLTGILSLGILCGAALWWCVLCVGIAVIGKRFQLSSSPLINRISGGVLSSCGFLASLSVLKQLLFFA